MDDAPPPAPEPSLRRSTRVLLVLALLFSGAAAGHAFLPWHITSFFGGDQVLNGIHFTEGKLEAVVGGLAALLFLATLVWSSPKARGPLSAVAACLALGAAFLPVWLIARGAYAGLKTVVEIGGGYTGWGHGLFLAAVAGFVAAATGSLAAGRLARRPQAAPVKRAQLRRTPRT